MRVLWHSTVPWGGTSYSVLTKRTVPELLKLGHDVTISTWWGLQGAPQKVSWVEDGRTYQATVLPSMHAASYGQDVLPAAVKMIRPDVVITCMDVWVLPPSLTGLFPYFAPWLPIDHDPAPEPVVKALETAKKPLVYSKWGKRVLAESGVEAMYVPCSAPSHIYRPLDKADCKRKLGIDPGRFVIGMVAANKDQSDRKGFSSGLQGFAEFARRHGEAMMYIHTLMDGAIEIASMCDQLGLRGRVIAPDQALLAFGMFTDSDMAIIMNAFDVLLNPALSEGFGLPILEAQMCGVPVCATDYSTTDELLWAGWKFGGIRYWSFGARSWRVIPDPDAITEALETAYTELGNAKRREALAQKARAGATSLDDKIVGREFWRKALAEIESELR